MTRSVARLALLFTLCLAFGANAQSASALSRPPSGSFGAVDGTTVFVQREDHITARDLATGITSDYPLPDGYPAVWNDNPIAGHGRFAGVAYVGGSSHIFETGPAGITTFTSPWSWQRHRSSCESLQLPLGISAAGAVTILDLAKLRDKPTHTCSIDMANTHLRLYALGGGIKELWFPAKYARWMRTGSASLRGNRLLVSRPATHALGGRFAVLDLSAKRVVFEVATGKHFTGAEMTARLGALARYADGKRISVRHFSLYRPHSWLVYRGTNDKRIYACGQRTLVAGIGSVTLLGLHGARLDHRARPGDYDTSTVSCSDRVALYDLTPNVPETGEAPDGLPPFVRGVFDLSNYRV